MGCVGGCLDVTQIHVNKYKVYKRVFEEIRFTLS